MLQAVINIASLMRRRRCGKLHCGLSHLFTGPTRHRSLYGCEVWSLTDNSLHKVNVAWNNCFRRIFSCCWRQRVPDLFSSFCNTLPISILLDERKLIFWYRMHCSKNPIVYPLSKLHQNRFIAIGCKYGIDLLKNNYVYVKEAAWRVFARTVTL